MCVCVRERELERERERKAASTVMIEEYSLKLGRAPGLYVILLLPVVEITKRPPKSP